MHKPYIICISGISGSGKTTISNELKSYLMNTETIHFDSFPDVFLNRDYCEWSESGADCNEWQLSPIIEEIKRLLLEKLDYIILDYPFGRLHQDVGALVDFVVWIDIPLDISLARRILRDFTRRSKTRHPLKNNIIDEVSMNLDLYLARYRDTYIRHNETVRPSADFIVDGTKSLDIVVLSILTKLKEIF